jgi:hypothetical protein
LAKVNDKDLTPSAREKRWDTLHSQLTDIAKQRTTLDKPTLKIILGELIDHLYITLSLVQQLT